MSAQNSYTLQSIVLLECEFKRSVFINFADFEIENDLKLDSTSELNNSNLVVTLDLIYTSKTAKQENVKVFIKMAGIFQCPEDTTSLPIDVFAKVNAPAMIFPFVREQLASLTMKAAISPVILQPLNFVKLKDNQEKT